MEREWRENADGERMESADGERVRMEREMRENGGRREGECGPGQVQRTSGAVRREAEAVRAVLRMATCDAARRAVDAAAASLESPVGGGGGS